MDDQEILSRFQEVKKQAGLIFYDTHFHPHDVFGFHSAHIEHQDDLQVENNPTLLERFHYNSFSLTLLEILFRRVPRYIQKEIKKRFKITDQEFLLKTLTDASMDNAVLVPIYPKVSPQSLYSVLDSPRFLRLGSVNFDLEEKELERDLYSQVELYSIRGIKLHPNIQLFYPHPSLNPSVFESKLNAVYRFAEKHKLYLLFHGGISFVPTGSTFEKREYALLKHFFSNRRSFIQDLRIPVVIAHLGVYNVRNPNLDLVLHLAKYKNVYFDTAGVNPAHISTFLKRCGIEKLLFGSDALYFNLKYNLILLLRVLYDYSATNYQENIAKVFSQNYSNLLKNI